MEKNRNVVIAFILGAVLSAFVAGSFLPFGHAQDNMQQTAGQIQVYTYPSSMTGFFDRNSGMVYVYDADLNKCVIIRQLTQLGEPMKRIRNYGKDLAIP